MLEIKKITKIYETDGFKQKALDNLSVNFREYEFASILGPSGSGKTTFLNIIGGLDHYTSGDLIINEISTKKYKDADWDSYRNHRIGFVFQSYNLITHQSILSNVMLALTLSGISKKEGMERAKKALEDVGLSSHMYKRPNQLSGGQMQRVAIARALVNDPEILLADEPTGALDSTTSIQIMDLLKKIAKNKLVIMVTHNPDLAKKYSNRIITLKDGKITSDTNPYDGKINTREKKMDKINKTKKTNMSYFTALALSFNNLMTKKGRTVLVAFAGSIGIIGIALILSLSNGFQGYVDKIQEDTLTSYPLNIMQESTDITGALLAITNKSDLRNDEEKVYEQQQITSMLKNVSTNDLKSLKRNIENNEKIINKDVSNIKYGYSVEPLIYTIDGTKKITKLNPSEMYSSMFGNGLMSNFSSFSSVFNEMVDNLNNIKESYELLKGKYPEKYDEMLLVLRDGSSISDLLVYSLGFRDTKELTSMMNKVMNGESANISHEPMVLTYDDFLNHEYKLIMPTDLYHYNSQYDIYEDMRDNEKYMQEIYKKALTLKIVGIVAPKEGTSTMALQQGIAYRSDLTKYIINYASEQEMVKKQLKDSQFDVISGKNFEDESKGLDLDFKDLVIVDNNKIASAFGFKINQKDIEKQTINYMKDIKNYITTNIDPAKDAVIKCFKELVTEFKKVLNDPIALKDLEKKIDDFLNEQKEQKIIQKLSNEYVLPKDNYNKVYKGLLNGLMEMYLKEYNKINDSLTKDKDNPVGIMNKELFDKVLEEYEKNGLTESVVIQMAKLMTESLMNKEILARVGDLTSILSNFFAKSLSVDASKIASAFTLKYSEEEITRLLTSMLSNKKSSAKSNLISFGYQDFDEPTIMSFYFNSFDGKENFLEFLDNYNKQVDEEKQVKFSDTTGILMNSVKTIVNAVSYVLIAFVSISLVVSSIMIGIITYISVFERTKEIGILRAIGASKRNISSIFNAETFIIGLLSGLFGIGISYAFIPIINGVIHHFTGNIPLSAVLKWNNALVLVILSIFLTLIGGLIPAKSASKKDPVEALRSE